MKRKSIKNWLHKRSLRAKISERFFFLIQFVEHELPEQYLSVWFMNWIRVSIVFLVLGWSNSGENIFQKWELKCQRFALLKVSILPIVVMKNCPRKRKYPINRQKRHINRTRGQPKTKKTWHHEWYSVDHFLWIHECEIPNTQLRSEYDSVSFLFFILKMCYSILFPFKFIVHNFGWTMQV